MRLLAAEPSKDNGPLPSGGGYYYAWASGVGLKRQDRLTGWRWRPLDRLLFIQTARALLNALGHNKG